MALNLGPEVRRPSGKPTILQIINAPPRAQGMIAIALCRTDNGTEVLGVDGNGKLFLLQEDA